jgi:hypothetical protein
MIIFAPHYTQQSPVFLLRLVWLDISRVSKKKEGFILYPNLPTILIELGKVFLPRLGPGIISCQYFQTDHTEIDTRTKVIASVK